MNRREALRTLALLPVMPEVLGKSAVKLGKRYYGRMILRNVPGVALLPARIDPNARTGVAKSDLFWITVTPKETAHG